MIKLNQLNDIENILKHSFSDEILDKLYILSDEQWHTYHILNNELKSKISEWIINGLPDLLQSLDNAEKMSFIIGSLGLDLVYFYIKENINSFNLSDEIFNELSEMLIEFQDNIYNPYSGIC